MKTYSIILFALLCLSSLSHASGEQPSADAVVVKVMEAPLPHDKDKREGFLWDTFANKPDEKIFNSYGTENWEDNFTLFSKALVQKADKQKLDSGSLRKALALVLKESKGKIAYLPVGAYQTALDENLVWIVIVKWEVSRMGKEAGLGHICMFAFDQKTLKQVAFNTCM
jgi:hypothetical protein